MAIHQDPHCHDALRHTVGPRQNLGIVLMNESETIPQIGDGRLRRLVDSVPDRPGGCGGARAQVELGEDAAHMTDGGAFTDG